MRLNIISFKNQSCFLIAKVLLSIILIKVNFLDPVITRSFKLNNPFFQKFFVPYQFLYFKIRILACKIFENLKPLPQILIFIL